MKAILIIIAVSCFAIPQGLAMCAANEDWPDAPCLDTVSNGCYDAEGVGKWSEYYYHKGGDFMEAKRADMMQALGDGTIEEWSSQSFENSNVHKYHYLKGEIPDYEGKYYDVIKCPAAFHMPGNPLWPIPYSSWLVLGAMIGVPSLVAVRFWKKR